MYLFRRLAACVLIAAFLFVLCAPVLAADPAEAGAQVAGKTLDGLMAEFMLAHHLDESNFSLCYYNTVTGEEHYHRGDEYMITGSMFKVPLNMLYTEKVAKGEIDWDTKFGGIAYSNLLEWSIINSDNQMAEILWKATGSYRTYRELICPYMGVDAATVDAMYWVNNYFTSEQMIYCLKTLYENQENFPRWRAGTCT